MHVSFDPLGEIVYVRMYAFSVKQNYAYEIGNSLESGVVFFFFQAEDGIRDWSVTGVQTCALPIYGQLFGFFNSDELVAAGRLCNEYDPHWKDAIGEQRCWWLSSLTVCRANSYPAKGHSFLRAAFSFLEERACNALHLDCVNNNEFLPRYYESCGFERMCEKSITYKSGNTFPMVLMKASVPNHALQGTVASSASLAGSGP